MFWTTSRLSRIARSWIAVPGNHAERSFLVLLTAIPTLIVLGMLRAIPILLGIVTVFVLIAFRLSPNRRENWRAAVSSPALIVALAAAIYAHGVTLRGDADATWLGAVTGLPVAIAFQALIIVYVLACHQDLRRLPIPRLTWIGCACAIGMLCISIGYTWLVWLFAPSGWHENLVRHSAQTNRGLVLLSMFALLMPAASVPRGLRSLTWSLIVALIVAVWIIPTFRPVEGRITHNPSDTAQLGLLLALTAYALVHVAGRRMTDLLLGMVFLYLALAPWIYKAVWALAPPLITQRRELIMDRIEIWNAAAERYLSGNGFHLLFGRGRDFLRADGDLVIYGKFTQELPVHPHSAILQAWLDGGVLGAAFLLFFSVVIANLIRGAAAWQQPAFMACLVMVVIASSVTHAIWNTWYVSGVLLVFTLMLLLSLHDRERLV